MSNGRELTPINDFPDKESDLQQLLAEARRALNVAEAELAQEQAEVNAFRMHCRLKLDVLVDALLDLRAEKQTLITRLQLLQQAEELGIAFDEDDPFWRMDNEVEFEDDEADLLLPTPTPRDKAAEKRLYRELARRFHPDLAKSAVERAYRTSVMATINTAYQAQDVQALYDLAGEIEPSEIAELAGIESSEVRRLRENILKCRQLRRKAVRQLQALRQESTARMWQRARELDVSGQDYWSVVQRELESAIARRESEVLVLRQQVVELESSQMNRAYDLSD